MKRLVLLFGLLIVTYPLFASLDPIDSYTNFKIKKELWVCSSIAFPIDIAYDAFNIDFKAVIEGKHGYFIQVIPGKYKDGHAVLPSEDSDTIILNPAKGVLSVLGKPAGVYEYIFVSTDDDFCGMSNDEKAVVRVYIVPQPTGFPVLTNLCPGQEEDVDFSQFIPAEIKYFIDEMGWTLSFKGNDGKDVTMPVKANLSNVGNNVYQYTINDDAGDFRGRYDSLQKGIYYCPEDSAYLTHTVRIREGAEYAIPDKKIAFCTDVLKSVPETFPYLNINLFSYMGTAVSDGTWSLQSNISFSSQDYSLDPVTGDVKIPWNLLVSFYAPQDSIIFKYSYKNCEQNDVSTTLTFNFNPAEFQEAFSDAERDICRNLVSGVVDLASLFGFTVPLTSGIWYEKIGEEFQEMLYGAVDLSDKISGSLYTYRFDVSNSIDELCLVQGTQDLFNLRIHDVSISNAEIQLCKLQYRDGIIVDLFRYVPGLNDETRIDPNKVTWRDPNGIIISTPRTYRFKSTEDWEVADTSSYTMPYRFEVTSDCGPFSGYLYVTPVDSIRHDMHKKIQVCYTDEYASYIDLFQILGIAGASGNFILCEDPKPAGKVIPSEIQQRIEQTGIMNANALFNENNTIEEYTFCYAPASDSCIPSGAKVTIIVTKNVNTIND
jgi:hypothetical protein